MTRIVPIVEGDGEVKAVPILLRRMATWMSPGAWVDVEMPIRVRRDRFLQREQEFHRVLLHAANKSGDDGWLLILLDADDDCPAQLGRLTLERARVCVPHRRVSVVLPNREYEAWFLAAARSLHGKRGFCFDASQQVEAERPRNTKLWMTQHMPGGTYQVMTDQPAFSAEIDLDQAHAGSRSFRKLCSEFRREALRLPA